MGFYLSPLVKVREIDLSTTIPAVASSIAAITLRNTFKGPELKPQLITTEGELTEFFGEPTDEGYGDWFSAAGYLKYGNKLYATRAVASTGTFAQLSVSGAAGLITGTFSITGGTGTTGITLTDLSQEDPDNFGEDAIPTTGASMFIMASSRGEWGNDVRVAFLDRATQYNLGLNSGMSGYITGTDSGPYKAFKGIDSRIDYNVASYVTGNMNASGTQPLPTGTSRDFIVLVQAKDQRKSVFETKETFNVSTDSNALDDQGQSMYVENLINSQSSYIRISTSAAFDDSIIPTASGMTADTWFTLTGGTGSTLTVDDATIIDAYNVYANGEEIDVNLFIDGAKSDTVKMELINICETRMDSMAILDVAKSLVYNNRGQETTDLINWVNNTFNQNTSYAATYANWIEIFDKYNQKYRWIPSSGYMAGIYAKTDDVADPWWAPAGLNRAILTGVRRLAWNPSQPQRDLLYSNKLNPIVSFSGQGKVVWGQKTLLSKASAFDRVNVRRLFIILEKAISTAAKYFLFEPNDPATRNLLVNMIEPFLRDIKGRRGIYDYLVVSDDTINTPERIDRNELWVNIFIKPTRTAEFIILNFIATKTGVNFSELSGNV